MKKFKITVTEVSDPDEMYDALASIGKIKSSEARKRYKDLENIIFDNITETEAGEVSKFLKEAKVAFLREEIPPSEEEKIEEMTAPIRKIEEALLGDDDSYGFLEIIEKKVDKLLFRQLAFFVGISVTLVIIALAIAFSTGDLISKIEKKQVQVSVPSAQEIVQELTRQGFTIYAPAPVEDTPAVTEKRTGGKH
ncbi:MAG: hypothetical protein PHU56_04305 [Candidatus Pacebacteria bacterium]|nr:hypothetical protein [Candidatus Paceibacterota bacterium]